MRRMTMLAVTIVLGFGAVACNTVRGAGQDARSIGQVFSDHPDRDTRR